MYFTKREQQVLAVLLAGVLSGLAVSAWRRHTTRVSVMVVPGQDAAWRDVEVQPPSLARVDINTASVEELQHLPGVGPALAARIVRHRELHGPFRHIENLDNVAGIGPVTVEELRPWIVVDGDELDGPPAVSHVAMN